MNAELNAELRGNVRIQVHFLDDYIQRIDKLCFEDLLKQEEFRCISTAVIEALESFVTVENIEDIDDLTDDDMYVGSDSIVYFADVRQGCSVWSDKSVGIECATDDDITISNKDFSFRFRDVLRKLSPYCESIAWKTDVSVSDEELIW